MNGKIVTHYKILEKLGEGGMGVVYKARDIKLDRFVALKFLPPQLSRDKEDKNRFIQEAKAASSLDHPNICTIHEIDQTEDNQLFVVMTCYEGQTLKEKIQSGPLNIEEAINIAIRISQGLSKAHEQGITHRDIKPSNIFLTNEGDVKIIDFGLAKLTGRTSITKEGTTLGTVNYMSPEQAKGSKVDHRTDIWSLGVVLYEILTGQRPFQADYDQAVLYSIINQEPEPVSQIRNDVPVELDLIIQKAMAKNPDERYSRMDEMLNDLKLLFGDNDLVTASKGTLKRSLRKTRAKTVILSSVVFLIALTAFLVLRPLFFEDAHIVSQPKPIAVIAFANQTGDPSYDYLREAIPNLLITNLEQSKYLRVMTWERMKDVLKQMGKTNEGFINKDLGFELCRREGINTIVIGSFIKAGNIFATDAKVLDVGTMELLKTVSARGEGVQSILSDQIDKLSNEISRSVGLSSQKIEEIPTQIAQVTTSSMDAYNFFLRGRQDYEKLYFSEARRFLEKAVTLDTNFALAYLYLSNTYGDLLEIQKMREALLKAKKLSNRAPEKERLAIESRYAAAIEKIPGKRLALLQELVKKYPQEKRFHNELGQLYQFIDMIPEAKTEFEKAIQLDPEFASPTNGLAYIYAAQGHYDKAIETLKHYADLSPGDANPYDSMGEMYLRMGRIQESIAKYRDAIRAQPSFFPAYRSLAYVYALNQDYTDCLLWIDSLINASPTAGIKADARAWKACYLDIVGRHKESLNEISMMFGLVKQMGTKEPFSTFHWMNAWRALHKGNMKNALQEFSAFHDIYSQNNPQTPKLNKTLRLYFLTIVDMRKGHLDSARIKFEEMRPFLKSLEWYKEILTMMSGILESELLLEEGKPEEAVLKYRSVHVVLPLMLAGWQMSLYNIPSLRDVVPRAFQSMGQVDSAVAAYNKLVKVDTVGKDRRLISPIFHYRLAKLYEKSGNYSSAVVEYKRFLKLWKNADKDHPELMDAHKRLANLMEKS